MGSLIRAFCCSAWIILAVSTAPAPWPTTNLAATGANSRALARFMPAPTSSLTTPATSLRAMPPRSEVWIMVRDICASAGASAMPALIAMSRMIAW
ncbi:hypothetical protein D3C80_1582910 [compost metagenome]